MSAGAAVLDGVARNLAANGFGVFHDDRAYTESERGIVVQAWPETPRELVAVSLYDTLEQMTSPTATAKVVAAYIQVRYRITGNPLEGISTADRLKQHFNRKPFTFNGVAATGFYLSYAPMGIDDNGRHVFASNFRFDYLESV